MWYNMPDCANQVWILFENGGQEKIDDKTQRK